MGIVLLLLLSSYLIICNSRVDEDYYIDDIIYMADDDNARATNKTQLESNKINAEEYQAKEAALT